MFDSPLESYEGPLVIHVFPFSYPPSKPWDMRKALEWVWTNLIHWARGWCRKFPVTALPVQCCLGPGPWRIPPPARQLQKRASTTAFNAGRLLKKTQIHTPLHVFLFVRLKGCARPGPIVYVLQYGTPSWLPSKLVVVIETIRHLHLG